VLRAHPAQRAGGADCGRPAAGAWLGALSAGALRAGRRDNTKAEAVEQNRAGLEGLLNALLQNPALASDHDLAAFLQLTEAGPVAPSPRPRRGRQGRQRRAARPRLTLCDSLCAQAMEGTAMQSPGSAAQPGLEQRPGPTPLSVRPDARPAGLDEADATEEGADGAESSGWRGQNAVSAGGHAAMEPADGGVWIGR